MSYANSATENRNPKLSYTILGFDDEGKEIRIPLESTKNLIESSLSGVTNNFTLSETAIADGAFVSDSLEFDSVTSLKFNNKNTQGLSLLDYFQLLNANKDDVFLKISEVGFEVNAVFRIIETTFNNDNTTTFTVALYNSLKRGSFSLETSYTIDLGIENYQPDYNQTDSTKGDFIKNKPTSHPKSFIDGLENDLTNIESKRIEENNKIGGSDELDNSQLQTTDKTSHLAAINEVKNQANANETNIQGLSSGVQYAIPQTGNTLANEPAPTADGKYPVKESGTLTNWGGLVIPDLTGKIGEVIVSGGQTQFDFISADVSQKDALPEAGSTNAVESDGLFNEFKGVNDKINEILNPEFSFTELFNQELTSTVTTTEQLTAIETGKRYKVTATSSDDLSSGLTIYTNDGSTTESLHVFASGSDFPNGVSFEFTSEVTGNLLWRVFASGLSVNFLVEEKLYVSQDLENSKTAVTTINAVTKDKYLHRLINEPITVTTLANDLLIEDYQGLEVDIYIEAPYTGNFTIYSKDNPYVTLTPVLAIINKDFTTGFTTKLTVPSDAYYLTIRTFEVVTLDEFSIKIKGINPVFLSNENQWKEAELGIYGDSQIADAISVSSETNLVAPFTDNLTTKWAAIVGDELELSKVYIRGIGGQKFAFGTNGGSVSFINADGTIHSRNDSYNYDNYTGNVSVPSGTTPSRSAFCSWLRITTNFPASIKDNIKSVFIMGGTNDSEDATAVSWIASDTTDTEWANSTQYANYNGDFNINTLQGGVASTIMKFQAWMPNATIVIGTPLGGRSSGVGQYNFDLDVAETVKSTYIRQARLKMNTPLIDVNADAGINGWNSPTYTTDGIHIYNEAGRKATAFVVVAGYKRIYPKNG